MRRTELMTLAPSFRSFRRMVLGTALASVVFFFEVSARGTPIQRSVYTFLNNAETKFADCVAYKNSSKNIDCKKSVNRNWKRDPNLGSHETLIPDEYDASNVTLAVDRGHQVPLGSFKCHSDSQMTNYLSNITPQFSKLNQGAWKGLEAAVRKLAETGVDVWVMTAPLYEWPMAKLPSTKKLHAVPSSYWKIISVVQDNTIRSSAFILLSGYAKASGLLRSLEDK